MGRGRSATDEAVRDRIRGAGLRCTAARVAVMRHLQSAAGPLTHAEVSDALDHLGFDRATIYRNLTELTEAGLAARVELGDHVWRFEAQRAGGHRWDDHAHFVCTTCGEVSCVDGVEVALPPQAGEAAAGKRPAGGRIGSVTEVLLKGRCERCD
jgi:Fur family ferric uptake transcriptional regulator